MEDTTPMLEIGGRGVAGISEVKRRLNVPATVDRRSGPTHPACAAKVGPTIPCLQHDFEVRFPVTKVALRRTSSCSEYRCIHR